MRVSRRGFMGLISSIGAAMGLYDNAYSNEALELQYYRGYRLKFTGWKETQTSDRQYAQWTALPEIDGRFDDSRPRLYVAIPGGNGAYRKGDCFDVERRTGQPTIEWWTHPAVKDRERKRAGKKLIKLVDDWYSGKIPWSPKASNLRPQDLERCLNPDCPSIAPHYHLAELPAGRYTAGQKVKVRLLSDL